MGKPNQETMKGGQRVHFKRLPANWEKGSGAAHHLHQTQKKRLDKRKIKDSVRDGVPTKGREVEKLEATPSKWGTNFVGPGKKKRAFGTDGNSWPCRKAKARKKTTTRRTITKGTVLFVKSL